MAPTLRDGRLALTGALPPAYPLRRGDLVVAEVPGLARRVVKRVVGLPGERVTIRGGAVVVDGVAIDEPYASSSVFRGDFEVPQGHYLLLGDNRDASDDARSWSQPYVAQSALVGRLVRPRQHVVRPRRAATSAG
jgi:signal peptidase I